jgi:hypothetical protein
MTFTAPIRWAISRTPTPRPAARARQRARRVRQTRLIRDAELRTVVLDKLEQDWRPEQIAASTASKISVPSRPASIIGPARSSAGERLPSHVWSSCAMEPCCGWTGSA